MSRHKFVALLALALPVGLLSAVAAPAQAFVDRDCSDFPNQRAAQIFFIKAGGPRYDPHRLDRDGDGIVCESLPDPSYYGTTLPPTHHSSSVSLTLSSPRRIVGEKTRMTLKASPAAPRVVKVQRQGSDGTWRAWTQRTTSKSGVATVDFSTPNALTSYRAIVVAKRVGKVIYDGRTSPARRLYVDQQTFDLVMPTDVGQGDKATAKTTATPVRKGRAVTLQRRVDGTWKPYGKKGKENSKGQMFFTLPTGTLGETEWRAVLSSYSGATFVVSAATTLAVVDRTAPVAPETLTATAGDEAVSLSWSTVSDASNYLVQRSADGSTWSQVVTTSTSSWYDVGLTNGTAYTYRVFAYDAAGNQSVATLSSPVTPTAAP